MDFNDLSSLRYFVSVYELKSLTAAALKLGVTKVAVAKRVVTLEKTLGVTLFVRSTRKVQPTSEAQILYERSQTLLSQVKIFEDTVFNRHDMGGPLRITAPPLIVQYFLGPLMTEFQASHRDISVELISSDSYLDIAEHNIDLALRMGKIPLNSLVGKKLAENRVILCAAPKYLKKQPEIRTIADLKKHPLIFIPAHDDVRFEKQDITLKEIGESKLKSNDPVMVTQWGVEGHGVVARSTWSIQKELEKGQLVPVLKNQPLLPAGDIWLVASPGRLKIPRVRNAFDSILSTAKNFFTSL